jgi:LysM repeat protein
MQRYPVKERDTLWSIGRQFGVSVDALAKVNGLKGRQIHLLRIDQVLLIPDREAKAPKTTLELKFRGLDFSLLTPDRVKVQHDGCTTELSLDATKSLKLAIADHSQGLNVWIETADKQMEQVFSADCVPIGKWALSIDSRMVKAKGELQPARGPHTASTAEVKQGVTHNAGLKNGGLAQQQTRVEAGAPVHGIATVYTGENLRLEPSNEKYRALIIAAAKKYDLTPQSLAAMIAAEASKNFKTGEWLEESNKSFPDRAQGLCQFFEAGWTAVFGYQKSLLYAETKSLSPTVRLKKRLVAKYAIDSIAAYAVINLEAFEKQTGLGVGSLPAEEKA